MTNSARIAYAKSLGLPGSILKCISGEVDVSLVSLDPGCGQAAVPPAFLPFWGSPGGYDGYWQHRIVIRKGVFVDLYRGNLSELISLRPSTAGFVKDAISAVSRLEDSLDDRATSVMETARTPAQFIDNFLGSWIDPHEIDEDVVTLAYELEVPDLGPLTAYIKSHPGEEFNWEFFPTYAKDLPLASARSFAVYDGEFPTLDSKSKPHWSSCCQLEANSIFDAKAYRMNRTAYPTEEWFAHVQRCPWLQNDTSKPDLFRYYAANNEWDKAWLCLNAGGWEIQEAWDALEVLERNTLDSLMPLLVDSWKEMAQEWSCGY